jgi:hypothetical protein
MKTEIPGVRKVVREYADGRVAVNYEARVGPGGKTHIGTFPSLGAAEQSVSAARQHGLSDDKLLALLNKVAKAVRHG